MQIFLGSDNSYDHNSYSERESNQQMSGQLKSETIQCQRHARHCPPRDDDDRGLVKFASHYAVSNRSKMERGNKAAVYAVAAS